MKKIIRNRVTLSLLLSLVMTNQVGCSRDKVSDDAYYLYEDEEEDVLLEDEVVSEQISEEILIDEEKVRSSEIADSYVNFFDSYEVNYNYQEYFISEEEVTAIYEEQNKELNCSFVNDDNVSTLYDKVRKNSFEYLESHSEYESCFLNDGCDVGILEQGGFFKYIFYLTLNEHFKDSTNNLDEDVCRMQNLKIVYDDNYPSEGTVGWYDELENVIYLCRNNIIKWANDYLVENNITYDSEDSYDYNNFLWRYYYLVLSHEFEHMCHSRCNCVEGDLENEDVLSYSKNKDGFYYVSTLIESSAESAFINFDNEDNFFCYDENFNKINFDDYNYISEREIESIFMLMALFNENVTVNDYYSAIGNADINALLDFFDMNTEEGRYTFYKLLYVIDGVNGRSDLIDKYKAEYGSVETYDDLYNYGADVGSGYRAEMFKIILSRLIGYTKNNADFTLKENLLLFNFIKDKIVDGASFLISRDEELEFRYDDKFVIDVIKLEEEYINFLSEYYGISVSLVREIDIRYSSDSSVILKALVDGEDTRYYEIDNCNVALELLEKFPLLKPIISSGDYLGGYNSFLRYINDNMTYSSGKGLKLAR